MPATAGNPPRFFGVVSAAPGALRRLLRVAGYRGKPPRFPGAVRRPRGASRQLLRVAGNRENPPRFSGVVSAAPGGVEAAFERCRLLRETLLASSELFRRLRGALRRLLRGAGFRRTTSRFSGVVSAAPGGVETAFESCRQPRKPSSLLWSRFGGPGGGGGVEAAFESCWQPGIAFSLLRSRFGGLGALRRLLRVAGNLGNPSRFS